MPQLPALDIPENGKLAHNITHFARALRKAGLPIGPGSVIDAIRAVEAAGFTERTDFYWTLHACFVRRPEHRMVFAQVFRLYWRDPRYLEHMMAMMLPAVRGVQEERPAAAAEKRAAEALLDGVERDLPEPPQAADEDAPIEIDASLTASAEERLRALDFEQMSADEMAAAKRMLARLRLPVRPLASRRTRADRHGRRPDWRATFRQALRQGGEIRDFARKARRTRWPNLVVLCDISGSMSAYSRAVLHFLHAVSNHKGAGWARVHAFTFGTRLTNITRHMRARDVDAALAAAGAEAQDWEGGTRIGACLHTFNRDWSRRVMADAVVLLDHRRARPRRGRRVGTRDRTAAPFGPPPDLDQPALALGRVRSPRRRDSRDAAPCRQLPRRPQHRGAGGTGRGDRRQRRFGRQGAADGASR